jgi:hypothetical protein
MLMVKRHSSILLPAQQVLWQAGQLLLSANSLPLPRFTRPYPPSLPLLPLLIRTNLYPAHTVHPLPSPPPPRLGLVQIRKLQQHRLQSHRLQLGMVSGQ